LHSCIARTRDKGTGESLLDQLLSDKQQLLVISPCTAGSSSSRTC